MIKFPYLILLSTLLCSCASLLNQMTQQITIETNKPCEMMVNGEKLPWISSHQVHHAIGSKDSLHISFKKDNLIKQINVAPQNPASLGIFMYPDLIYSEIDNPLVPYLKYKPNSREDLKHKNILKLTPINVIQLINPDIELSYERLVNSRLSVQVGAAYLLRNNVYFKYLDSQTKGLTLSLQSKYFYNGSAPFGEYLAIELYCLRNNYRTSDSFRDTTIKNVLNPIQEYTDTFNIKKTTLSLNFLFGYQYRIERFTVDLYCGLGLRYRNIKTSGRKNPQDGYVEYPDIIIRRSVNEEGQSLMPNFSLNFRIGYNF